MKVLDWLSRPEWRRPRNTCFLLDPAEASVNVKSNTDRCATSKLRSGTRGGWPFRATHYVNEVTSETLVVLTQNAKSNGAVVSKSDQAEEASED